ncbi:MAG: FtsX-like permease family protein [Gammaproteobacteria bacterium]|nr:FtsX-like permease family protein [Gammaproteobacteria bacterium]
MTAAWRFAWRALLRDLRAGELHVLAVALVVAAGAVSTVGLFTDRVERALAGQAAEVLAADVRVDSGREVPAAWREEAAARGLETVRTLGMRSVAVAGERTQLVEVKAAEADYPLRGALRIAPEPGAPDAPADGLPAPGRVWVDVRLLHLLDLEVGDRIGLGRREFTIDRVLTFEPDRGMNVFSIGPRVLMHWDDLESTGLVLPASRVHHHWLIAGDPARLAAFQSWLRPRLGGDYELEGVAQARPELRGALERAGAFLHLAALVSVLLAGVAVAMAAQRHARRQADGSAVLRCLGASRRFVLATYAGELALLGLLAGLLGCGAGFVAQAVIGVLVAGVMGGALPGPAMTPALVGLGAALAILLGFALPPLLRLGRVSPLRVLRRELEPPPLPGVAIYLAGATAMAGLMLWLSRDAVLTGWVLAGIAGTLTILTATAGLLVLGLRRLRRRSGLAWRFGLLNLARRARASLAQLLAFGLALTVMLLLTVVRGDLLDVWRATIPPGAPNLFLVNVQPDEVGALAERVEALAGRSPELYPMVRGRLVARNGAPVDPARYESPRARRLATREFNLSYAEALPEGNRVAAGAWWDGPAPGAVASVERGLAETLGLALGDRLRFRVAEREFGVTVTSLREVAWDSFRVNFFVILPPEVLAGYPATFITSFHLPAERRAGLGDLVRDFPSVTVIDVEALLGHVRRIVDRVTLAIEFVFGFTLLAGLAVLYAAIHASLDQRRHEASLLRALGARRGGLLRALAVEFLLLGALAGLLGAAAASGIGWLLAREVFDLPWHGSGSLWLLGPLAGMAVVGTAGLAGTWRVTRQPPLAVLRRA